MAKKNQHVVPFGNGWAVKSAGATKAIITTKKSDAISLGKDIAQKNHTELIVHGKDGRITERNSYGKDANPPKG
jgi:hypothetical protein